jgi:hypothetical protein
MQRDNKLNGASAEQKDVAYGGLFGRLFAFPPQRDVCEGKEVGTTVQVIK